MTKFTPEFIAEMRALAEKASPAPWREGDDEEGLYWVIVGDPEGSDAHDLYIGDLEDTCQTCHANATMIVEMRNNFIPALDEIERLTARVAELEQAAKVYEARMAEINGFARTHMHETPQAQAYAWTIVEHDSRPLPTPPEVSNE